MPEDTSQQPPSPIPTTPSMVHQEEAMVAESERAGSSAVGSQGADVMDTLSDSATSPESSGNSLTPSGSSEAQERVTVIPADPDANPQEQTKENETMSDSKQTMLRKEILSIQLDSSLSPKEKASRMQKLMSSGWTASRLQAHQTAEEEGREDRLQDDAVPTADESMATFHNEAEGVFGCPHYRRNVKLKAACCGRWFPCRFCHDEACDHKIVRRDTRLMMCMSCKTIQPAGPRCTSEGCGLLSAHYYCDICKLWDNDETKHVYHCDKCGICRIGRGLGDDFFHCDKCNVCLGIGLQGNHRCIERNLESNCPICNEFMFTSTATVIFMRCGHSIHSECHREHTKTSYQCPTCFKSLGDMNRYYRHIDNLLQNERMPPEYDAFAVQVYCHDCEKSSYAKCHFQFHRCAHCQGYNTRSLGNIERAKVQGVDWKVIDGPAEYIRERMAGSWPSSGSEGEGEAIEEEEEEDEDDEPSDGEISWVMDHMADTEDDGEEEGEEEEGEAEDEEEGSHQDEGREREADGDHDLASTDPTVQSASSSTSSHP